MNSNSKIKTLSILSFGLIGLCFVLLLQEVVLTRQQWQEIPRIFGGLLAPVPLALFLAFCFVHRADSGRVAKQFNPITGFSLLLGGVFLAILIGLSWRGGAPDSEPIGSGPALAQSSLLTSSVLNLLFVRSPLVAAALSGLSVGLVVFVVFLT